MENRQVIDEMRAEAHRLMESSKTPNGKLGTGTTAIANRSLSYKLTRWANVLEGVFPPIIATAVGYTKE